MLLQALREYSMREGEMAMPPYLYSPLPVRYIVNLDRSGRYLGIIDTSPDGREAGMIMAVPHCVRGTRPIPYLFADKADYTFGFVAPQRDPELAAKCHRAYMAMLTLCYAETGLVEAGAVLTFLQNNPLAYLELPDGYNPERKITFCLMDEVSDIYPVALPGVQEFWARHNTNDALPTGQCLVCGEHRPLMATLKEKLQGIPGAAYGGAALVAAHENATWSYGLKETYNSPVCTDCAERFTKAANHLLSPRSGSSLRVGDGVFIFWTKGKIDFDPAHFMDDPDPEQVRALLRSLDSGEYHPDIDEAAFYVTGLAQNRGRVGVRDWITTSIDNVNRQLAVWFRRQHITGPDGDMLRPLGLFALAFATLRPYSVGQAEHKIVGKERSQLLAQLRTTTISPLLRGALTGAPLPFDLLDKAVRRCRIEGDVTRIRAALIKLVLISNGILEDKEDYMVHLEEGEHDPAYLCGRLFAVLTQAQGIAMPGVGATIARRFSASASSSPASVLPYLVNSMLPVYIGKMSPGLAQQFDDEVTTIVSALDSDFPATLDPAGEGKFCIGFYQQKMKYVQARKQAILRKAARESRKDNLNQ